MFFTPITFFLFNLITKINSLPDKNEFQSYLTPQNYEVDSSVKCIIDILDKEVACNTHITIILNDSDINTLLKNIYNTECYTAIVKQYNTYNWIIFNELYIMVSKNSDELLTILLKMDKGMFWNPRARFIIHVSRSNSEDISEMFEAMIKLKIYKVVIITNLNDNVVKMYTYNSFNNNGSCGKYIDKVIELGNCDNIENIIRIIPKVPRHGLQNCTITVSASEDVPNFVLNNFTVHGKYISGIEQYIFETISRVENVHIKYDFVHPTLAYGVVLPNGTVTGQLQYLNSGKSDFVGGGYILIINRAQFYDHISGYDYALYKLFTPMEEVEHWRKIYQEFDCLTYVLIMCTFIFIVFVIRVVRKFTDDKSKSSNSNIIIKLWGYLLGQNDEQLPREKNMRSILIFLLIFAFSLNNFYYTGLYSLITANRHIKRQISVENINEIPYQPCVSDMTRALFLHNSNKTFPKNKYELECKFMSSVLRTVYSKKDVYGIEMEYNLYSPNEESLVDSDGIPKLAVWEFTSNSILCIFTSRGFPLLDEFNNIAIRMFETGHVMHRTSMILKKIKSRQTKRSKTRTIRLIDLIIPFAILLLGVIVSCFCLFIERCIKRIPMENR